jgi:hypothetical protein
MSKMGLHDPFQHLKHKLWPKEGPGVKLGVKLPIWLPTTKSREATRFPCVQVACNKPLKSSRWGLQLCFKPHLNWRSTCKVMGLQSCKSPECGNFETPIWESVAKMPFGCEPAGENVIWMWTSWRGTNYTIRGKVVTSPSPGCGESC